MREDSAFLFSPSAAVGRARKERYSEESKLSSSERDDYFCDIFPRLHRIVKKEPPEVTVASGAIF